MSALVNHPLAMFALSFLVLSLATWAGVSARAKRGDVESEEREDFGMILGSTLTLLGLIIGFTFSMAISRYDQRKNYEEEEANAIGTEYLRADLLPTDAGARLRTLLREYLVERVKFYEARWPGEIQKIDARTGELEEEMWKAAITHASDESAVSALTVAGMNDVINRQGYTQAAWWNRIPKAAWALMWAIAVCCNWMIGFYVRPTKKHWMRLGVVPLIVAISFLLIADIDSPRWGIIRVIPQNLLSVQAGLK